LKNRLVLRVVGMSAGVFALASLLSFALIPEGERSARLWLHDLLLALVAGGVGAFWADALRERIRRRLEGVIGALAAGDLALKDEGDTGKTLDEFPAARRLLRSIRNLIGQLQSSSAGVSDVSASLGEKTRHLSADSRDQVASVEEANASIRTLDTQIGRVVEEMDSLSGFTEQTSSSVLEMRSSIDEVVEATRHLADFVDEIAVSMTEMARSIEEVASHSDSLSSFAVQNSSAMVEMDATIGQIEENIRETDTLSQQVSEVSREGSRTVKDTVQGLEKIHAAVGSTLKAIESLGSRSKEIGKILKVIRDIADQTNLLALNAAIIAAQAGEHGKGFAVVAEEIRDLAERTASATSEVSEIVTAIQREVGGAVDAAGGGMDRVQEGLALGRASEESLQRIAQSINLASTSISHILRAAAEQSKSSRQVTEAMEEMTKRVERISLATREQADTGQVISQKTLTMKDLTKAVEQSTVEQARGSDGIAKGMETVRASVVTTQQALLQMSQASQRMVEAMGVIGAASQQTLGSARDLSSTAGTLRQDSILMVEELAGFRMPEPVKGGELRLGYLRHPYQLDPAFSHTVRDAELCHDVFQGLLRFGLGTQLLPGVARRWTVSTDGLVYTFWLDPDAQFHNGRRVTAKDVLFSWHRTMSPRLDTPGKWFLAPVVGAEEYAQGRAETIAGVTSPDETTVQVRLKEPLAFFLYMVVVPESGILAPEAVDPGTLKIIKPVGTGPYRVLEAEAERVTLVRHEGYHIPGEAFVDRVVYDYSSHSGSDLEEKLRGGEVHLTGALPPEALESLLKDPTWHSQVESTLMLNTILIAMRCDQAPLDRKEIRQALNWAVDRDELANRNPHARPTPARGIFPPGILGYDPGRKGFGYDPEKARWLLSKAGVGAGLTIPVHLDETRVTSNQDLLGLVHMFAAVGVKLDVHQLSHEEYLERGKREGRPLLYPTGWHADYPDPDNFTYVLFHSQAGDQLGMRWQSATMDELTERARRSLDLDERMDLYRKAEDLLIEEAPCILLYHGRGVAPHRREVGGLRLSITPPMIRSERLWLNR